MGLAHDPTGRDLLTCARSSKAILTKSQAKSMAKRIQKRGPAHHVEAYRCRYCDKWHVGNERQRRLRR